MIARIPPTVRPPTLEEISDANPGWKVEREPDGSITMSPTGSLSGIHDTALVALLLKWQASAGGQLFGSSTGFKMADGAILSPDASWMTSDRWRSLSPAERLDYGRLVPDVCIEVVSKTDSPIQLIHKLQRYRGYGATYVLLVDPFTRTTWSDGAAPDGFPTDFTSVFDAGME
jgi:Uma2 family endonuclease